MRYIILLTTLMLLLPFSNTVKAEEKPLKTLNVCTHLGFEPFVIHTGSQFEGIDVDIVDALIKNTGLKARIVPIPWARLLVSLRNGTCDIGFSLFDREERRHYVDYIFDVPLHFSTFKVFAPRNTEIQFEKVSDLYGLKIGHNRGFALTHELDLGVKARHINRVRYDDTKAALNMLSAGRIDAILDNELRIKYYLKKLGLKKSVTILDVPFIPHRPAFLVFSKKSRISKSANTKQQLRKELIRLKDNGTISQITAKYTE